MHADDGAASCGTRGNEFEEALLFRSGMLALNSCDSSSSKRAMPRDKSGVVVKELLGAVTTDSVKSDIGAGRRLPPIGPE